MPSSVETAHRIPLYLDHAFVSASKKRATLPHYRYAIRVLVILVAVVGDILLIGAAALTAAFIRFQSLSGATTSDLLLVIVPTFMLAAVALDCYQLNTLRHRSVGRTLIALAIAAGLAFTTAFAFKVGAIYSRLETGIMLVSAAAYLTLFRCLYKAVLGRLSDFMDPRVLVLGRGFQRNAIGADFDHIIPLERPNPADPHSLERTYALVRKADRIILAFDNARRTDCMGSIRSTNRYRCRTYRTGLAEHYGSRSKSLGRNANVSGCAQGFGFR